MSDKPMYLRKYQILVGDGATNALDVSDLRCVFTINKKTFQKANYADVKIYNLTQPTTETLFNEGKRVIIKAGYEGEETLSTIFDGQIFQPTWSKENGVDYILGLHCIDGDSFLMKNFVAFCAEKGYKYHDIVMQMAREARTPIPIGEITDKLSKTELPRGKVIFGDPRDVIRGIAQDNNAQAFVDDGKMNMVTLADIPKESIVINQRNGLVGSPQQIQYGFTFTCLLNPRIRIYPLVRVKLETALIAQEQWVEGTHPSILDYDRSGVVKELTHQGDTRGNEWYTHATCIDPAMMLEGIQENPN
jgi:hypothetical protein